MLNFIWHHSQAVRQRSAKPLFPGPIPGGASKCSGLKRCRSKNPRFSRVFFVFRRFPHFFKIRIKAKIKRCQTPISTLCAESDRCNAVSGRFWESFSLKKTALFSFFLKKTLLNFCVLERRCFGSPTYIKKKIATAITACIIPKENANCSGAVAIRTKYARGPPLPQTWKK